MIDTSWPVRKEMSRQLDMHRIGATLEEWREARSRTVNLLILLDDAERHLRVMGLHKGRFGFSQLDLISQRRGYLYGMLDRMPFVRAD